MKSIMQYRLLPVILALCFLRNSANATIEPIPSGSFIINMGVIPQTYSNGIKPWGMVYDLIHNYKVQVKWVISQTKLKDGTDFSYNGTDYKGGTLIIPAEFRTAAVNSRIAYWQSQGVVGITTTAVFSVDVTYTLKYTPRWTFDFQNGNIAINYLNLAGIPSANYPKKYPDQLAGCDDLFVMPHAEPTWETHKNLLYWNKSNRGWIWYGCHAGSVVENLFNPADPTERMNLLSANGLVPDNQHSDGNPPYQYLYPNDAEMQFMGVIDAACQNGAEQVYLPVGNSGWRPTTKTSVHNPTQQNMPALSTGPAGILVYGRGFGDDTRGKVMMQAGHDLDKGNADAVAAIRGFFNYSFLSVYDKAVEPQIAPQMTNISGGAKITYSVQLPAGVDPTLYSYYWTSDCGSFSNPYSQTTVFTASSVGACTPCHITVVIADGCGREYYQKMNVQICPIPPVAQDITTNMIINNPGTPAQKIGNDFPLAGTDEDGWVINYTILTLPTGGLLSYDADNNPATPDVNISSLPANGLVITKSQIASLKFDPVDGFSANASFTYTVTDNNNLLDQTPATYTIPVDPPPIAKTFICIPTPSTTNIYSVCPMEATDEGTIVSYTIVTLPPVNMGRVYLLGVEVDPGQVLSPMQINLLKFKPGGAYVGYAEITYTATDEKGVSDQTPATLTLQLVNQPPVTTDISAPTIQNPVGTAQVGLPKLAAVDNDGTIASYMITTIPPASQGTLYLNNLPVSNNQVITLAQADDLKFDAKDNFAGIAKFYFTSTDNDALTDNTPATYSIPVRDILPTATNVNNDNINAAAGLTSIKPLAGNDPDSTNVITEFIITELPAANLGVLYYNNNGNYLPVNLNQALTPAQAASLKYDPAPWVGNVIFRYTVKDDEGFSDPTWASFKIPQVNVLPKALNVTSQPIPDTAIIRTLTPGLNGSDEDGTVDAFVITSLPNPLHGVLKLNGIPVGLGTMISAAEAQQLQFSPVIHHTGDAKFKFAAVDNLLTVSDRDATYTIKNEFIPWKFPPSATSIVNPVLNMNPVQNNLVAMNGTDPDGTITGFVITQIPAASQGVLYVKGIPAINGTVVPVINSNELSFVPTGTFKGTASFKYKAEDNDGLLSNEATFQVPVTNSNPVAESITIAAIKRSTTTNLPALQAADADGSVVSYRILSLPNNGTLKYDSAGTGTIRNIQLNQVITSADAARLRYLAVGVLGNQTFTFSAKDNIGDTSAVATYTMPVAANAGNQIPIAYNVLSTPISFNNLSAQPVSPLSATDIDGTIETWIINTIPPSYYGTLLYNKGTTGSPIYEPVPYPGFVLEDWQGTSLRFQTAGLYMGNVVVRYQATDDAGGTSIYKLLTVPLVNTAPVANDITNTSLISSDGPKILSPMTATDDGTIIEYFITSLPDPAHGTLIMDGYPIKPQQVIPLMYLNRIEFDPNPAFTGTATFKFSVMDNARLVDATPATFSIPVTNDKPIAEDKLSQVITNQPGTGAQVIPQLTGIDADGTITGYYIQSIPSGGQLFKNGNPVNTIPVGGYFVSVADASKLSFDPFENWSGTATFTYTVRDNSNNYSISAALYVIPVNLAPVTSNVNAPAMTTTSPKSPIPALVGSDDGTVQFFTITELPPAYAGILYVNNVQVTSLAQVDSLTAAQIAQLSYQPSANFDGAIFTYTATDNLGVIDVTPAVYRIPVSSLSTLPVKMQSFTGKKAGADNVLEWSTIMETNSNYFELEYSRDGNVYDKIANINAKGNTNNVSNYDFTHAQVQGTIAYYRLKIVDRDLNYEYSNIVVIKRNAVTSIDYNVYPNPFAEKITVNITAESNSNLVISLFDMQGRQVRTQQVNVIKGNNVVHVDRLNSLTGGTYIMTIKNNEIQVSMKLLKTN